MKVYEDIDAMEKLRKQEEKLTNETLEALKHYNEVCDKVYNLSPYYKPKHTTFFDTLKQNSEKAIIKHELLKLYRYYRKMYIQESSNLLSHLSHGTYTYNTELFKQLRQVYVDVATVLYKNFDCRDIEVSSTYEIYVLEERC